MHTVEKTVRVECNKTNSDTGEPFVHRLSSTAHTRPTFFVLNVTSIFVDVENSKSFRTVRMRLGDIMISSRLGYFCILYLNNYFLLFSLACACEISIRTSSFFFFSFCMDIIFVQSEITYRRSRGFQRHICAYGDACCATRIEMMRCLHQDSADVCTAISSKINFRIEYRSVFVFVQV